MYKVYRCTQCQDTFEADRYFALCEFCEGENMNDLYQAQEIDWYQERDHV